MVTAQKDYGFKNTNLIFTVDHKNLTAKSEGYIGKLKTNFYVNEFALYDKGDNPVNVKNTQNPRENLCSIIYVFLSSLF